MSLDHNLEPITDEEIRKRLGPGPGHPDSLPKLYGVVRDMLELEESEAVGEKVGTVTALLTYALVVKALEQEDLWWREDFAHTSKILTGAELDPDAGRYDPKYARLCRRMVKSLFPEVGDVEITVGEVRPVRFLSAFADMSDPEILEVGPSYTFAPDSGY